MKNSRFVLLASVAVVFVISCHQKAAQHYGYVAGTVRDGAGQALAGVRVTAKVSAKVSTTDNDGHYLISDVPSGAERMQSIYTGHVPATSDVDIRDGETTHVDLTMDVSRRNVSAEMVATSCSCAVANRLAAYRVVDARGDRVTHVEYHASGDTAMEREDEFRDSTSEDRRTFYDDQFQDGAWMYPDGARELKDSAEFGRVIDSMMDRTSPVQIELSGTSDGDAVTATARLIGVDDIGTRSKLGIGITEKGPIGYRTNGGESSYVRDLSLNLKFTDYITLAPGDERTYTLRVEIPDTLSKGSPNSHVVNKNNLSIFAIVQDMDTRQIHQSAKKGL